jgi:hypothetical protein
MQQRLFFCICLANAIVLQKLLLVTDGDAADTETIATQAGFWQALENVTRFCFVMTILSIHAQRPRIAEWIAKLRY